MSLNRSALIVTGLAGMLCLMGCARPRNAAPETYCCSLEKAAVGALPSGWRVAQTNPTREMARWEVLQDDAGGADRRVLGLVDSKNYDGTFNLAIAEDTSFRDLDLSVRVKAVSGTEDQGGGPIWRCRDENNYYICRINPLESNFRVYVVAGGKRRQLDSIKLELAAERWYVLRVRMVGDQITCWLDGEQKLTATDGTIPDAGRIGLWTKADAVTSFDDLTAAPCELKPE